ncbi:MAG TPA: hypothetical protein PLE28_02850 [bacterium]|nr:hypothetical protein [bacterium]
MIKYSRASEFEKDLKKLTKRFRSLPEDLLVIEKAVIELYHEKGIDNQSTFQIPGFFSEKNNFWKIKKFACKSLKGSGIKSGIRVIYRLQELEKKVLFLEIYFKGDKENEDKNRIKKYLF